LLLLLFSYTFLHFTKWMISFVFNIVFFLFIFIVGVVNF
jgi:hypothetical protein